MRKIRCSRCKKKFEYECMPPEACPTCMDERANAFAMVRDLVIELPGITALEVHDVTGVPMSTIMKYVSEGHLSIVPNSSMSDEQRQELLKQITRRIRAARSQGGTLQPQDTHEQSPKKDDDLFQWH